MDFPYCKLEIFLPESHLPAVQDALRSVDAGHIGNYDSCLSFHPGRLRRKFPWALERAVGAALVPS